MSSRALRKAQKQREEEAALQTLAKEAEELESSEGEDEISPPKSAFALLGGEDDDKDDDEDDVNEDAVEPRETEIVSDSASEKESRPKPSTVKRKKKKKGRSKITQNINAAREADDDLDAILESLKNMNSSSSKKDGVSESKVDPEIAQACRLLSVDPQSLHAENEMKRLFGRAAVDSNDDDQAEARGGRRRNQQRQMMGLAGALGRQQTAGGRSSGLGLLALRRNPFIAGKEEWPSGTSGGLSMEVVRKDDNDVSLYRFVHNNTYQEVQRDFEVCVQGMDPERMVRLLQLNPYHISTLLQVSEIATREGDHSTSGDLLERALFTFGRSLHSTFPDRLAHGKARLSFRRPENRELWLAISRYITNLSMRSTWRTVLEWAKLMLSLDPTNDPYQVRLVIDQYAIRARQPQILLDMNNDPKIAKDWHTLPSMQFSVGLALLQTKQEGKGKQAIFAAARKYPWMLSRLFQELNLDPPPAIWGKSPRTERETLHAELYAIRAKDLWTAAEAHNVLLEVSSAVAATTDETPKLLHEISLNEGRHVLLTDKRELIALLPKWITSKLALISDPLPPPDNEPSYSSMLNPTSPQPSSHFLDAGLRQALTRMREMSEASDFEEPEDAALHAEIHAELVNLEQLALQGAGRAEIRAAVGRIEQFTATRRAMQEANATDAAQQEPEAE